MFRPAVDVRERSLGMVPPGSVIDIDHPKPAEA
jgi:hypothetical protein